MSSWRSSELFRCRSFFLQLTVMACSTLCHTPAAPQTAAVETAERVFPLEVTINKTPGGIWPIVARGELLYAPPEAFASWRVQIPPDTPSIEYRGLRYVLVSGTAGLTSRLDAEKNILDIAVASESFAATRLTRELSSVLPRSATVPALFLNYDLNFGRTTGNGSATALGLLAEAGLSGKWGVLTQSFVGRDLAGSVDRTVTRLETAWRKDFPDQGYTVTLGDSVTRTGLLGRATYFGGLQMGTNFSLAPYINRQPIPLVAGETSAPSVVQLYVNDVLRQTSNVPAGPFTLDNLPTLSGNGEVTLRVRDILGRETLITQPFFVAADLLAPALNDWSVEIGKLRRDLGSENANYGRAFASGMWRRGITTTTTLEGRAESSGLRTLLGLAGVHAIGSDWLVRSSLTASRDAALGVGHRWMLGADRPDYRSNLAFNVEGGNRAFRYVGDEPTATPVRLQLAGQGSWYFDWGRVGLAVALQRPFDRAQVITYSLNYSTTIRERWQLSAYFTRAIGTGGGFTVGTSLSVPLGPRTSTSTSVQIQRDRTEVYSSVTHSPASTSGLAWRALVGHQGEPRAEAGVYYLSPKGLFSADIGVRGKQTDLRLGAVGGLLWAGGRGFAMPRFDTGAALVEVPGYPGVGVGLGGNISQLTDANGLALITPLASYQKNPIRLDANDLPVSAEVDSIEIDAVPPWRSVAKITFPVRGGRGALVRIHLDDDEPVPAGATVEIPGEDRIFYVARRGEAYVTGLKEAANRLQLQWRGNRCDLNFDLPPGTVDDIARIGPLRCTGVKR